MTCPLLEFKALCQSRFYTVRVRVGATHCQDELGQLQGERGGAHVDQLEQRPQESPPLPAPPSQQLALSQNAMQPPAGPAEPLHAPRPICDRVTPAHFA